MEYQNKHIKFKILSVSGASGAASSGRRLNGNIMCIFLAGVFFVLLAFGAQISSADTDYICLKGCINNGGAYAICMPKCTYDTSQSPSVNRPHTDYICLKTCVDSATASATCVPQCTHVTSQSMASSLAINTSRAGESARNLFKAPLPYDGIVLQPANHAGQISRNVDYGCMKLCVQGGLQYQLCNQRCEK